MYLIFFGCNLQVIWGLPKGGVNQEGLVLKLNFSVLIGSCNKKTNKKKNRFICFLLSPPDLNLNLAICNGHSAVGYCWVQI